MCSQLFLTMYFPQLFTSVSWGCTIHQDMASLDGLQGGLKELLGENLRCTESRFALNLALATRNAEACPDVFNNMSEQFNLERRSWCWYVQFLLLLCVWCRASWEGWGKNWQAKLRQLATSSDNGGIDPTLASCAKHICFGVVLEEREFLGAF